MNAPYDPFPYGPGGASVGAFIRAGSYRPRWWLHILLFVLTFFSTTFFGAIFWGGLPIDMAELSLLEWIFDQRFLLAGLEFSIPLLTILMCHEMGHYLACRHHRLLATPPFFIPFIGIGTLGAVIRIKEPIRNKRQLLDIGAAGPIAGFVALLPFLAYGIQASTLTTTLPDDGYLIFGEPLTYRILEMIFRPDVGEGTTLLLHPTGVAAWFGIFITLLNLLPLAQLDGGHIAYALFGRFQALASWPLVGLLVAMGVLWHGWWLWAVIAVIMGPRHPRIWDEAHPLDGRRKIVAWICFLIFILCFMPAPIEIFD